MEHQRTCTRSITTIFVTLGLLLTGTGVAGRCPRPCTRLVTGDFKKCKHECPKGRAGKPCRSTCGANRKSSMETCRSAVRPAPPLCGATPIVIPSTTTTTSPSGGSTTTTTMCVPVTCASAGVQCGPLNDGCGGLLACGQCPDGVCNADGACVLQCQGEDASACSSNKCDIYTCDHGRCVLQGPVVCPLPPEIPDCYGPAFCNAETGNCDRTYLGDNRACGLEDTGNASNICCGGQCASLLTDSTNCGACGSACVDSVCFQGACFDGCVIDGKRYVDGEPDPANQCRVCKTAFSRTSWSPLDSNVGNIHYCNKGGCVQSQCYKGQCGCGNDPTCGVLVPENTTAGCVSTPCADAVCENNVCVYHAKAEGQDCNAAFDPRSRISRSYGSSNCTSQFGTCQSGICAGGPGGDGMPCLVDDPFADGVCSEPVGVCAVGQCVAPLWTCVSSAARPYCNQTLNTICDPNTSLVSCEWSGGPLPPSGTIACGTAPNPEPQNCCAGQLCVCPPTAAINQICFALECWNPSDLAAH